MKTMKNREKPYKIRKKIEIKKFLYGEGVAQISWDGFSSLSGVPLLAVILILWVHFHKTFSCLRNTVHVTNKIFFCRVKFADRTSTEPKTYFVRSSFSLRSGSKLAIFGPRQGLFLRKYFLKFSRFFLAFFSKIGPGHMTFILHITHSIW